MRWFQKDRVPDVWEFAADQPVGDIGAAQKIREICAAAGSIAETMVALRGRQAETHKASEAERYQAAVKCALELAKQISDDAMRDVSVSQIIALSVKAGHMKTAMVLLRAIRVGKDPGRIGGQSFSANRSARAELLGHQLQMLHPGGKNENKPTSESDSKRDQ